MADHCTPGLRRKLRSILRVAVVLICSVCTARADDSLKSLPVEFKNSELEKVPEVFSTDQYGADGVRAFLYANEPYQGKPTRVFAYYGVPQVEPGKKVPAMVLIHGGGGTAFDRWVKVWTARGYAAIAMDLCGCVPDGKYGDWKRHEFGGPPGWDASFQQIEEPVTDQWQWHAVTAVVRAHSLIRSYSEVDADRIGVTGISWGGYMTGLVAGVDQRFRFAIPVYGCGYLGDNSVWLPAFEKLGEDKAKRWLSQWDPSHYLPHAEMPTLWVNGTNDFAYPMDSWQKSYRLCQKPSTLCLRVKMPHGHGPAGENPEEIHQYANAWLKEGKPLPTVTGQGRDGNEVWISYKSETQIKKAELNYTLDQGRWPERKWSSVVVKTEREAQKVTTRLPVGTRLYYINLFDVRNCVVSSPHEELAEPSQRKVPAKQK